MLIVICVVILHFRRKYITEKDTMFSTNVCLLNALWQTKWKAQEFWQLLCSTAFKDCFLIICHISKKCIVPRESSSEFTHWLWHSYTKEKYGLFLLIKCWQRKDGVIWRQKFSDPSDTPQSEFVFCIRGDFLDYYWGPTSIAWNNKWPVGESWLHLNTPTRSENASQSYKSSMKISRCRICYT